MIQMSVSDQIIAVINDLCQKFGIAIDWSAENVLPYIKDLCGRYIRYEIGTSIAWCVVFAVIVSVALIVWVVTGQLRKKSESRYDLIHDIYTFAKLVLIGSIFIGVVVWTVQAFDIIECCTIPEKTILEYLKILLRRAQSS